MRSGDLYPTGVLWPLLATLGRQQRSDEVPRQLPRRDIRRSVGFAQVSNPGPQRVVRLPVELRRRRVGAAESCGKCTPCRIGSTRGVELIDRIRGGGKGQAEAKRDGFAKVIPAPPTVPQLNPQATTQSGSAGPVGPLTLTSPAVDDR